MSKRFVPKKPDRKKVNRAISNHEMWHQKEADLLELCYYDFPKAVRAVGDATHILYYSDKWEEPGKGFEYSHYFDSKPTVYHEDGEGRSKSSDSLLGAKDSRAQLTVLAVVEEISFEIGGEEKTLRFTSQSPLLCCTNDRKTLVIFEKNSPFFIRGGSMYVSERGIVK